MLNKKQKKILFWIVGFLVILLILVAVFIWPNFYVQYRLIKGVTITDLSTEEIAILKQGLGTALPDHAEVQKASVKLRPTDSWFDVIFELPKDQSEAFIASLTNYTENNDLFSQQKLSIDGNRTSPVRAFEKDDTLEVIAVLEYPETKVGKIVYQVVYLDCPQEIDDVFDERVRIMPK